MTKLQGSMPSSLVADWCRENEEMTKGSECVWVVAAQSYCELREVQMWRRRTILGGKSGGWEVDNGGRRPTVNMRPNREDDGSWTKSNMKGEIKHHEGRS